MLEIAIQRSDGLHAIETIWTLASSDEAAREIATMTAEGLLPRLYHNAASCRQAWAAQPLPMTRRYHVYAVALIRAPTGLEIQSSKRLDCDLATWERAI